MKLRILLIINLVMTSVHAMKNEQDSSRSIPMEGSAQKSSSPLSQSVPVLPIARCATLRRGDDNKQDCELSRFEIDERITKGMKKVSKKIDELTSQVEYLGNQSPRMLQQLGEVTKNIEDLKKHAQLSLITTAIQKLDAKFDIQEKKRTQDIIAIEEQQRAIKNIFGSVDKKVEELSALTKMMGGAISSDIDLSKGRTADKSMVDFLQGLQRHISDLEDQNNQILIKQYNVSALLGNSDPDDVATLRTLERKIDGVAIQLSNLQLTHELKNKSLSESSNSASERESLGSSDENPQCLEGQTNPLLTRMIALLEKLEKSNENQTSLLQMADKKLDCLTDRLAALELMKQQSPRVSVLCSHSSPDTSNPYGW